MGESPAYSQGLLIESLLCRRAEHLNGLSREGARHFRRPGIHLPAFGPPSPQDRV